MKNCIRGGCGAETSGSWGGGGGGRAIQGLVAARTCPFRRLRRLPLTVEARARAAREVHPTPAPAELSAALRLPLFTSPHRPCIVVRSDTRMQTEDGKALPSRDYNSTTSNLTMKRSQARCREESVATREVVNIVKTRRTCAEVSRENTLARNPACRCVIALTNPLSNLSRTSAMRDRVTLHARPSSTTILHDGAPASIRYGQHPGRSDLLG